MLTSPIDLEISKVEKRILINRGCFTGDSNIVDMCQKSDVKGGSV